MSLLWSGLIVVAHIRRRHSSKTFVEDSQVFAERLALVAVSGVFAASIGRL
jgi:hypothetical protein